MTNSTSPEGESSQQRFYSEAVAIFIYAGNISRDYSIKVTAFEYQVRAQSVSLQTPSEAKVLSNCLANQLPLIFVAVGVERGASLLM